MYSGLIAVASSSSSISSIVAWTSGLLNKAGASEGKMGDATVVEMNELSHELSREHSPLSRRVTQHICKKHAWFVW